MQMRVNDKVTRFLQTRNLQFDTQARKKTEVSEVPARDYNPLGNVTCKIGDNACAAKHVSVIQRTGLFHPMNESHKVQSLTKLQRQYGNRFVQRVIARNAIQAKLRIGQPGDVYEQEADRVADAVVQMPESQAQRQPEEEEEEKPVLTKPIGEQITPLAQKQVEEEEEELQAKSSSGQDSEISPGLEARINAIRGNGKPLPASTRAFFEPRFGYDFSQVRVHDGVQANGLSRSLDARAFTVGRDIVFGAGQYKPETPEGRQLLAHELTHVVQQGGQSDFSCATLRRQQDNGGRADAMTAHDRPAIVKQLSLGVQRVVSPAVCSIGNIATLNGDSMRARLMLVKAAGLLNLYSTTAGITPAVVRSALGAHFGTTLPPVAGVLAAIATGLTALATAAAVATLYICGVHGVYPCTGGTVGWAPWCLPGPIVVCPSYFQPGRSSADRSEVLIHEWMHKYLCRLDIGYAGTPQYPRNTFLAFLNADNFSSLVRDLW